MVETPRNSNTCTVFSVDDEPIVHVMLKSMIEDSGLPARIIGNSTSGLDALSKAASLRPDIFLLDINMDGMDGLDLADRLNTILEYRPVIVFLTAHDRFEYAQRALRLGAVEYILKPIRRDELLQVLRKVVNTVQARKIANAERETIKERIGAVVADGLPTSDSRADSIVRKVKKYIEDHHADQISLTTAADEVCLSAGYLGPLFKAAAGMTFRAYLRSVRIARAKELMKDHRLNLTEVAEAVGYDNVNYFSQAFLEETGVRPSDYRGSGRKWAN